MTEWLTLSLSLFHFIIYFISVLRFATYKSYTYFVAFIPKVFIFEWLQWVCILILVSTCSLLVDRNAIDFCMFISYPVKCWTHYISRNYFYRWLGIFSIDNHVVCKWGWFFLFSDLYVLYFLLLANCPTFWTIKKVIEHFHSKSTLSWLILFSGDLLYFN